MFWFCSYVWIDKGRLPWFVLSCLGPYKYSFDFVNCILCEIYKSKEKTTHLLYFQKNDGKIKQTWLCWNRTQNIFKFLSSVLNSFVKKISIFINHLSYIKSLDFWCKVRQKHYLILPVGEWMIIICHIFGL